MGKKERREVRHASLFCFSPFDYQIQILNWISLLQPHLPTQLLCLAFFLLGGCTWTCRPFVCIFFSLAFFLWFSIKSYPYFFQGPRLNCWEPFFSTWTTCLPRLNSLDKLLSLFYNRKFKHGLIQFRLLDHPSKLSPYQDVDTPCLFMEIWDLCIIKAEHIWTFYNQSWNMKPIDIGNKQFPHYQAHLGKLWACSDMLK